MKKNLYLLVAFVLLFVLGYIAFKSSGDATLSNEPLANFSIEDTSSVSKIFITDVQGKSINLQRVPGQRLWKLNETLLAKESGVDLLLKTFKRMKVRSSVPYKAKETVLKMIASAGRKVEVYTTGEKPEKIYYIGTSTPNHNGTYMVLEIPGVGRSEEPYIVYMEGFTGFLTTRFHTDEEDWRYTGIFEYRDLGIRKVDVKFNEDPSLSFSIAYNGGNDLKLFDGAGNSIRHFDTSAVKSYLLLYKKVHFDTYNSHLNALQEDSLRRTSPSFTLVVTDTKDVQTKVDLYWKKASKEVPDENGNPYPFDLEYLYGVLENNDVVLCQHYVFDPLLVPLDEMLPATGLSGHKIK